MEDCIFCKIIKGEIPCKKVYENENVLAFFDISPQAPTHIIVIPKEHISNANLINEENCGIIGEVFKAISIIAKENNIDENGYRIINNCGRDGGQTVNHLHFHILAGKNLGEKLV